MFEVVVSDRFATWYEGLSERAAEEVTLALEVAAGLGAAVDPERGRELLLWYDGAGSLEVPAEAAARVERFSRLVWWGRRVSQCLESPAFRERLAELDEAHARAALHAVERVKNLLAGARMLNVFGGLERAHRFPFSTAERWLLELILLERGRMQATANPSVASFLPAADAWLEQHPARSGEGPGPLQLAVLETLRLVGLSPRSLFDAPSGLREIGVQLDGGRSRLIVGVDVARERVVAILGERLDREYYGDSVEFAEAYFEDYLAHREQGETTMP